MLLPWCGKCFNGDYDDDDDDDYVDDTIMMWIIWLFWCMDVLIWRCNDVLMKWYII